MLPLAERKERDFLSGLVIHAEMDEGRVILHIDHAKEEAYIEASWPYHTKTLGYLVQRAHAYGYMLIPYEETPGEIRPNGNTRVWLMEI